MLHNNRGVSVVEFALIAPVFVGMLLVVFEFGFAFYAKAVLQGAVEEAARTATMENTSWNALSNRVNRQVRNVIPASDAETEISFSLDPVYYANYVDINLPEDFEDNNNNNMWDSDECFVDRNGNSTYDTDVGLSGRGGAQDVVTITATLTYVRPFPLWRLFQLDSTQTIRVSTYLRNQPFSAQAAVNNVRICPAP
ncbi:TadE/TadG family type IV pilus assembly protein [Altererythrobacter lauratis]|uniref:TadE/TadG family type IV pilus assembly protein n=1 Tax=Alteraurantiacibacter lauratis TaxID=2054627 RepID=UPI00301733D7